MNLTLRRLGRTVDAPPRQGLSVPARQAAGHGHGRPLAGADQGADPARSNPGRGPRFDRAWRVLLAAGAAAVILGFGILGLVYRPESGPPADGPVPFAALAVPGGPAVGPLGFSAGWVAAAAVLLLAFAATLLLRARGRERALRDANAALDARLRAYTDLSHAFDMIAVFVRSPDGAIRHWSAGCERLFGFTAAEALGRTAHELLGTRFPDGGRRTAQDALVRDGEWQGELRHRRRDGAPVIVAAHWILRRVAGQAASAEPRAEPGAAVVEVHANATALKAAEAALNAGEARLRLAQDVAGVGTWEWDAEADSLVWSPELHGLFGTSPAAGPPPSHEAFVALVHPDDREALRAAAFGALESGEYKTEFRILRPGRNGADEVRWLIGRGRRMPGLAGRLGPLLGVNVDITARKETEERQALLMREVDHRAKNALAVVQAILRLTRADSPDRFARVVEGRVAALARAQTLLTESRWVGADLVAMLRGELAPFMGGIGPGGSASGGPGTGGPGTGGPGTGDTGAGRVTLAGPRVTVAPVTAQPLSMALHELATNAAKYGSLSTPAGALNLTWELDRAAGRLRIRWTESGGPAIAAAPERSGFGSRVIRTTIREQLSGEVTFDWHPGGLVCDIDIPLGRAVPRDGT